MGFKSVIEYFQRPGFQIGGLGLLIGGLGLLIDGLWRSASRRGGFEVVFSLSVFLAIFMWFFLLWFLGLVVVAISMDRWWVFLQIFFFGIVVICWAKDLGSCCG